MPVRPGAMNPIVGIRAHLGNHQLRLVKRISLEIDARYRPSRLLILGMEMFHVDSLLLALGPRFLHLGDRVLNSNIPLRHYMLLKCLLAQSRVKVRVKPPRRVSLSIGPPLTYLPQPTNRLISSRKLIRNAPRPDRQHRPDPSISSEE